MKSDNKLYKHISIGKRLLSQKMFIFSDIFGIQIENDSATEKTIPDRKEMSKGNNTEKKTEYALVENPLNMNRTALHETTFFLNDFKCN